MMAQLAFDNDIEQLKFLPAREFTIQLMRVYCPQILLRLKYIDETIRSKDATYCPAAFAILVKINQEFNSMCYKEQTLLFPLLLVLEQENKTTDCKLFKMVKKHYAAMLSAIQQLKYLMLTNRNDTSVPEQVLKQAEAVEQVLIRLQKVKEKYLFSKFKSCSSSCASL